MTVLFWIPICYQLLVIGAMVWFWRRNPYPRAAPPKVSVLKPVRGLDEGMEQALRSQLEQRYPAAFEVLFGIAREDDPARPVLEKLVAEFPERARLIHSTTPALNGKVGVLIDLAREAQHAVLIVNDSDIKVQPDYLARVTAPLQDGSIGLVTCLYRATASSLAGRWEALGINTDFMPSTLVAPSVGVKEFGLGATLCFRRASLAAIGGFEAIADFLADDYQLAKRINGLGTRVHLSEVVVETHLGSPSWNDVWLHQVRWARTIRASRGDGYAGLPITHAGVWALLALALGHWKYALAICALRLTMGVVAGRGIMRSNAALGLAPLIPLWDLWAFCVWVAGYLGRTVRWRDCSLLLLPGGRLRS